MIRKLNASGLAHYALPLTAVVVVICGVSTLVVSHANPCKHRCAAHHASVTHHTSVTHHGSVVHHASVTYTAGMTIDSDGSGPAHGDCSQCHQDATSYDPFSHGRINSDKTNYMVLAPGWAASHGIHLGDLALVQYKNRKAFAIYADNYSGDAVHGEGSIHLARALGIPWSPATGGVGSGVTYTLYPGSYRDLNGTIAQSKINAIGRQYSR